MCETVSASGWQNLAETHQRFALAPGGCGMPVCELQMQAEEASQKLGLPRSPPQRGHRAAFRRASMDSFPRSSLPTTDLSVACTSRGSMDISANRHVREEIQVSLTILVA